MKDARRLLELALRQEGVVHRTELRAIGVTSRQQERLLRVGMLRRVTPAVFVLGGSPLTLEQRLRVALAQAGSDSAVSCMAAAARLTFPRIAPGAVEVTAGRSTHPRHTIGRVHRPRRPLNRETEVWTVRGLPTTSPARTLFDIASRLTPAHIDECLQDLCRRELVVLADVHDAFRVWRGRGRLGTQRIEPILEVATQLPKTESWLEAAFLRLLVNHGIRLPETQVPVEVDGRRYRLDALWSEAHLVVELNGYATHGTRAETTRDAARAARLTAAGYTVVVFTYDQVVGDPQFVVAQVQVFLARAASA